VIETKLAEVTIRVALPETLEDEAVMVQAPELTAVARPLALMVHTVVGEAVQETELVRFCVLPSDIVALAVNCAVVPFAALVASGVTVIAVIVALLTVTDAVAEKS
jgi:predicted ABC-type sugar transport system permease subunit